VRQGSDDLALHRDSVRVDFPVEGLAQSDGIVQALVRYGLRLLRMVKPKSEVIEEMETPPIDKAVSPWLIFGSEENGRGKDALKALHDPAVMTAILGQAEEIKHLGRTVEVDGAAPLLYRQGGNPNGDQAILPKRDGRFIMHLPQYRLGILCLFGVYLSCAPGFGVSVRLTQSA
jgi:hypothetical protein